MQLTRLINNIMFVIKPVLTPSASSASDLVTTLASLPLAPL